MRGAVPDPLIAIPDGQAVRCSEIRTALPISNFDEVLVV